MCKCGETEPETSHSHLPNQNITQPAKVWRSSKQIISSNESIR